MFDTVKVLAGRWFMAALLIVVVLTLLATAVLLMLFGIAWVLDEEAVIVWR